MDGELEEDLDDVLIAVDGARGHRVDPRRRRWLAVPRQPLPAQHAELADDPDRPIRVALHDGRPHRRGEHDEVAFGAGGAVEHGPLVGAVGPPDQPARQAIGEQPAAGERHGLDRSSRHRQLGADLPRLRCGGGGDERPDARHTPFVDVGVEGVVDLHQHELIALGIRSEHQPRLAELLAQPAQATRVHRVLPRVIGRRRPEHAVIGGGARRARGTPGARRRSPCRGRTSPAMSCASAGGTRPAACASPSACRPHLPWR